VADESASPSRAKQLRSSQRFRGAIGPSGATAFYAGLRRGELRALRWCDVDVARAMIRVSRSWDRLEGAVTPKSASGRRLVPIGGTLRDFLAEHRADSRWSGDAEGLAFGRTPDEAFEPSTLADRARKAWQEADLPSITLHEARHTHASLMAAAGVPLEDVADYMGHSTVEVTRTLYRHRYPDSRRRAADALEAFLEDAAEASEGKSKGKSASPQGGFQPATADQTPVIDAPCAVRKPLDEQAEMDSEAAQESNLPSAGLRRPAGFEDPLGWGSNPVLERNPGAAGLPGGLPGVAHRNRARLEPERPTACRARRVQLNHAPRRCGGPRSGPRAQKPRIHRS
jgi:hypothetical protein